MHGNTPSPSPSPAASFAPAPCSLQSWLSSPSSDSSSVTSSHMTRYGMVNAWRGLPHFFFTNRVVGPYQITHRYLTGYPNTVRRLDKLLTRPCSHMILANYQKPWTIMNPLMVSSVPLTMFYTHHILLDAMMVHLIRALTTP
jgi:hypothetical protein